MNIDPWKQSMFSAVLAMAAAVGALLAGCGGMSNGGQSVIMGVSAGVFAPSSMPYGKSYGAWGDEWWQWAVRYPKSENPLMDETGEKASVGQSGPVWFLAGTFGPAVERTCTIPAGKGILYPIVNGVYFCNLSTDTEKVARDYEKWAMDHVTELWATVDGVALQGLPSFRFKSPSEFMATFPAEDPVWEVPSRPGYPPHTFPTYAEGYWIMLQPLSSGQHTLTWGGKQVYPGTGQNVEVFEQHITYHVTVE